MAESVVSIEGAAELRRDLARLKDKGTNSELKAIHREGAEEVSDKAEPRIPVVSGRLEASLKTSASVKSGRVKLGSKTSPQAGVLEFGWGKRNIHPRGMLYPALAESRDDVLRVFADRYGDLARKTEARSI